MVVGYKSSANSRPPSDGEIQVHAEHSEVEV